MGFNSVLFLCNDAWGAIETDPKGWWETARHALTNVLMGRKGEFGFSNHANGFQAVWNQHADVSAVIIAGENWAEVPVTFVRHRGNDSEDRRLTALKALAASLGYEVRKKRRSGGYVR